MKRNLLLLAFILLILHPDYANATTILPDDITNNPIPYKVYDLSPSIFSLYSGKYLSFSMDIVYEGIPSSVPYSFEITKVVSGVTYRGTMYLQSTYIEKNKLYATYIGMLYAQ